MTIQAEPEMERGKRGFGNLKVDFFSLAVINAQMAIILFQKRCLNLGMASEAVSLKR